jgi:hypothetical protein
LLTLSSPTKAFSKLSDNTTPSSLGISLRRITASNSEDCWQRISPAAILEQWIKTTEAMNKIANRNWGMMCFCGDGVEGFDTY